MNVSVSIGQTIKLMGASSCKIHVGGSFLCYGYAGTGKSIEVEIKNVIGTSIIGSDGKLYPMVPEHDNDFYIIEDKKERTCPKCGNRLEFYSPKFWWWILGNCWRCINCKRKWSDSPGPR